MLYYEKKQYFLFRITNCITYCNTFKWDTYTLIYLQSFLTILKLFSSQQLVWKALMHCPVIGRKADAHIVFKYIWACMYPTWMYYNVWYIQVGMYHKWWQMSKFEALRIKNYNIWLGLNASHSFPELCLDKRDEEGWGGMARYYILGLLNL